MSKIWYAVQRDRSDEDWGTGSRDRDEALRMAKEKDCKIIAVIEEDDDGEAICIEEIEVDSEPLPMAVAVKNLRELSRSKSRAAFAREYRIPIRTLENWESGVNEPPAYVFDLLARAVVEDLTGQPAAFRVTSTEIGRSGEPDGDQFDILKTNSLTDAIAAAENDRERSAGKYLTEIRIEEGNSSEDEEPGMFDYDTFKF